MHKIEQNWGIHWFRRDLRIDENPALAENLRRTHGRTVGLFCLDAKFLARPDFSANRFAFFLQTLKALQNEWRDLGGDLLVIDCAPNEAFARLIDFCKKGGIQKPSLVTWNRDYEPYARTRDAEMDRQLAEAGVGVTTLRDHLLFEPHEILKDQECSAFYQIYSPYGKKWFEALKSEDGQSRLKPPKRSPDPAMKWKELSKLKDFPFPKDALDDFIQKNTARTTVPIPEAGHTAAQAKLKKFKTKLENYLDDRDAPAIPGTSQLSIYLKNGSLTTAQILRELKLTENPLWNKSSGPTQFTKELAWREFYYQILFHKPHVEKKSFLPKYETLAWQNNKEWFDRWKEGMTGFPIVDAGMRQLRTTGWMHNRVRMIVASFLTKDLLIDWRWGERYFMRELLDGDMAANNGGWQWAASTGCDPQPYFRVFNPWLQGKNFDPSAEYIRTYIPELRLFSARDIHQEGGDRGSVYPEALVSHGEQREKAISLYRRS